MTRLKQYRALPVFVGLVALAAVTGIQFEPGNWYAALAKPALTPPNRVFPVAWTLLYLLIAAAGWLAWQASEGAYRRAAMIAWGAQLLLNATWSWVFFGQHWTVAGLVNIVMLLAAIAVTIRLFRRLHATAALLLLPYFAWVGFALYLNAGIIWLN